jgi:hypothetical protein
MEDLLYVLAILAWVVYSFYKNSKKVKKQRPAMRQPREAVNEEAPGNEGKAMPGSDEYKSILRELFGEDIIPEEPEKSVPAQPGKPETVPQATYTHGDMLREREAIAREDAAKAREDEAKARYESWDDIYEDSGLMPSSIVADQEEIEKEIQADVRRAMEEEKKVRRGFQFDLRQAVIMSEILKRPYNETRSERTF